MISKVTEGSLRQSNYEGLQELRRFHETRFQDALSLIALERRWSDSYFSIIYNFGSTLGGEHFEFEYLRYVKVAEVLELDQGVQRLFNILWNWFDYFVRTVMMMIMIIHNSVSFVCFSENSSQKCLQHQSRPAMNKWRSGYDYDNSDSKYGGAENLDIVKGKREKARDVKKPFKPD